MHELKFIQGNEALSFVKQAYALFSANRQTPWSFVNFENSLQHSLSTVVCINSHLVGFVVVSSVLDHAEVEDICVDKRYRNQGIGSALINELIARAKRLGMSQLFLEVAENNQSAIAVYNKIGFIQTGRRKGYYKSPSSDGPQKTKEIDALLMQKSLS